MEVVDIRGDIVGGGFLGSFVGFGKLRRLGLASDAVEKRAGVFEGDVSYGFRGVFG